MRGARFHTIPALLLALLFLALPLSAFAADGIITGEVSDSRTGNSLPGANVMIEGTSIGAATDMDGRYVILQAPEGTFDLVVTFIGYHSMTTSVIVVAGETVVVNFSLNPTVIAGMISL